MDAIAGIFHALCAVLWVLLLIDCFRRRRFYPVFSTNRRTRIFWLITFLLMNPLLLLAYWLYGRRADPGSRPSVRVTAALFLIVLGVIAFRYVPWLKPGSSPVFYTRDAVTGEWNGGDSALSGLNASLVSTVRNTNSTQFSSVYGEDVYPLACRRVAIFIDSNHPLMRQTGLALQKQFMELPFVEAVDYFPRGRYPAAGSLAHDLYVLLSEKSHSDFALPFYRRNSFNVTLFAGPSPCQIAGQWQSQNHPPPAITFQNGAKVTIEAQAMGFETTASRHANAGKELAKQCSSKLFESLKEWNVNQGLLPELPAACYGPYRAPEPFNLSVEPKFKMRTSTYGLFSHCDAGYVFDDVRDTTSVIDEIKAEMESQGWEVLLSKNDGDQSLCLRAQKGKRYLYVHREPRTGFTTVAGSSFVLKPENEQPFQVQYVDAFTKEEVQKIVDGMLADGTDPSTVALFKFWMTDEQRELVASHDNPTAP